MISVMNPVSALDWTVALLSLTALELVLGIDNIVILAILTEKLPKAQRAKARNIGLVLAMVFRLVLLSTVSYLVRLTEPLLEVFSKSFSGRDLVLIAGGLFLLSKATTEIYRFVEVKEEHGGVGSIAAGFGAVVTQIVLFDMVFSFDSVLTAVGLTSNLTIMMIAVVLSILLMIVFSAKISDFVHANPGIKMLALSFLVMIGALLVAEGWGGHLDRGYIYFAMAFSLLIELLNRHRRRRSVKSAQSA